MALKDTVHMMKKLLHDISHDIEKAFHGNKAASQRVRTHSIKFEKVAKMYRKESIAAEKKGERPPKKTVVKAKSQGQAKKGKAQTANSGAKKATAKLPLRKK